MVGEGVGEFDGCQEGNGEKRHHDRGGSRRKQA